MLAEVSAQEEIWMVMEKEDVGKKERVSRREAWVITFVTTCVWQAP